MARRPRAVAGLLTLQVGRVALDGTVLLETARGVDVPAERRRCGVVFQDARLFPHLSVETTLRYGTRRAAKSSDAGPDFDEVVVLLGIGTLLRRRPRRAVPPAPRTWRSRPKCRAASAATMSCPRP